MSRPTGYSLYSKQQQEMRKENPLAEFYPPLPSESFDVIYADPPWDYGGKMQFDLSGLAKNIDANTEKVFISAANFKYPTVKTRDLQQLPVQEITAVDALLFMWTTSPHLEQALQLGAAWGFSYKTVAFVWDKMVHNPGQYTLSNTELCLVFKHGRIPRPRGARNVQQLIRSPRRAHSQKPVDVRLAIERMFPTQSKVELFARERHPGWHAWGLDAVMDSVESLNAQDHKVEPEPPSDGALF